MTTKKRYRLTAAEYIRYERDVDLTPEEADALRKAIEAQDPDDLFTAHFDVSNVVDSDGFDDLDMGLLPGAPTPQETPPTP